MGRGLGTVISAMLILFITFSKADVLFFALIKNITWRYKCIH